MSEDPKKIISDDVEAGDRFHGEATTKHEHDDNPNLDHHGLAHRVRNSMSVQTLDNDTKEGQIFSMNDVDPALDAKMRLVNNVGILHSDTSIEGTDHVLTSFDC